MIALIQKMMAPIHRRVMLMVNRAVISMVNDTLKVQVMQVDLLQGEVRDGVERFQEYGYTSVPFPGAEAVMVSVGGNHDHGIVIAVDDRRYRLTGLQAGEVALYDDQGQKVHLTRSGIVINGAGKPVTVTNTPHIILDAPLIDATGDLHVAGNIVGQGDISDHGNKSMAGMRQVFGVHTHNETGTVTAQPNQVM